MFVRSISFAMLTLFLPTSQAKEICTLLKDATVLAQDNENTKLGKIASPYDSNSIFNEYGTFGSQYSTTSIWNPYGTFGNQYSTHSATNKYTSTPPMIVKGGKVLGYLTVNKGVQPSISPNLLKELCKDEL